VCFATMVWEVQGTTHLAGGLRMCAAIRTVGWQEPSTTCAAPSVLVVCARPNKSACNQ
jgi:hypothetical protein